MNPPDMNSRSLTPLTPPRLLSRRCSVAKGVDVYIKREVFLDLSIHYLVEGNVHLEKSRRDEVDSFLRREPLFQSPSTRRCSAPWLFRTLASELRQDSPDPSGAKIEVNGRIEIGNEILLFERFKRAKF